MASRFKVAVVTPDDADQRLPPTELAAELLRCIEQQALLDAEDDHPYGVSIVGTRAEVTTSSWSSAKRGRPTFTGRERTP